MEKSSLSILLASFFLLFILIVFSWIYKLSQEKEMFFGFLRAFFQLIILGYLLNFIFSSQNLLFYFLILLFMTFTGALISSEKVKIKDSLLYSFFFNFFSLFIPSGLLFLIFITQGVIKKVPNEFIPFWGLIMGNSIGTLSLSYDRFVREVNKSLDIIENKIALGDTLRNALSEYMKISISSALIPKYNVLKTSGIILIPGLFAGMVMAGASPVKAAIYQFLILISIFVTSFLSSWLLLNLCYKYVFYNIITPLFKAS